MDYNNIIVTSDDAKRCMMNIASMMYEEYSKLTNKDASIEEMLAYYAGNKYNKTLDNLINIGNDVEKSTKLTKDYERSMSDIMRKYLGGREWWLWWVSIGYLSIVVMARDYMVLIKNLQMVPNINLQSQSRSCLNSEDPNGNWWVDLDNIIKSFNYIISGDTKNRNFTDQSLRRFAEYFGGMMWEVVDTEIVDDVETSLENYYTKDEVDELISNIEIGDGVSVEDIESLKSDVSTLQTDVSDLSTKVTDTTTTIYNISSSLTTAESNIESLTETVNSLSTNIDDTLEPITTAISELEDRVETNESDIDELKSGLESTQSDVSDLSTKVTNTTTTIYNISSKLSTAESNIVSLTETVDSLSTNIDDTLEPITTSISELEDRVETNESDIDELKSGLESTQSDVSDLSTKVTDTTTTIYNISSKLSTTESNIDSLTETVNSLSTNIDDTLEPITTSISELEDRVETNESDIDELKSGLESTQSDVSDLSTKVTDTISTIYALSSTVSTVSGSLEDLQDDVTDIEESIDVINIELDNIDTRLDALENPDDSDTEFADSRVDGLIQDNEDISSAIYVQSSSINTLQTSTSDIQAEITTLSSNTETNITNLSSDLSDLEVRVDTNESDIDYIKDQLTDNDSDITSINTDITDIVSTLYVLANRIDNIGGDIYTKEEIDEKIDSLEIPEVDLSDYYTKEEVDDKFTDLVESDGFEEIVTDAVNNVIDNLDEDTFATKTYVDEKIDSLEIPEVDLSDYYTKEEIDTSITTERLQVGTVHIYETTKEDDGVTVPAGYIYTERGNIYTTKGNIYTTDGDVYSSDGDVYSHTGKVYAEGNIYSRSGDFEAHSGSFYKGEDEDRVEVVYKDELDLLSYTIPEDVISSTTGTQEEILSRFGSQEEFDKFLAVLLNNQDVYIVQGSEVINIFSREISYSDKDEQTSIKKITLTFINSNGSKIQLLFTYNSDDEAYSYTVEYINYTGDLNLWEVVNTEQGYIGRTTGNILSSDRLCDRAMSTYIPVLHSNIRIQIWNPNLIDNSEYDNLVDNPWETKHVGYILFYDEDKAVVGLTYITTNLYDGTDYTMHGCNLWKDSKYMRIYLTVGSEDPDNYTYDEDIKIMISWGSELYDYRPSVADIQGDSIDTEVIQNIVDESINNINLDGGEITF